MNKQTQKRNAAFNAATKSERAVMVAKDALKMLDKGKILGSAGDWVNLISVIEYSYDWMYLNWKDSVKEKQICDISDGVKFKGCNVCALGALMLSEIRHTNNLKLGDVGRQIQYGLQGKARLTKLFSERQQRMMEYAFEGGGGLFDSTGMTAETEGQLKSFYWEYAEDDDRLRAILKNVIKNGGKFVLPK